MEQDWTEETVKNFEDVIEHIKKVYNAVLDCKNEKCSINVNFNYHKKEDDSEIVNTVTASKYFNVDDNNKFVNKLDNQLFCDIIVNEKPQSFPAAPSAGNFLRRAITK